MKFVILSLCKRHSYLTVYGRITEVMCFCCVSETVITVANIHYRPPENNPDLSHQFNHADPLLFSSLSLTYTNQTIHQLLPPSTDLSHGQAFLSLSTLPFLPLLPSALRILSINVLLVSVLLPSLHQLAMSSPFWINYNQ